MQFEWDEDKRRANIAKHGIDFIDVAALFDGRPVVTYASPRNNEKRWSTTGAFHAASSLFFGPFATIAPA
jgi:uncharacterized protein